jgi:serralysin
LGCGDACSQVNDRLYGFTGADISHSFAGAGLDRVTDFNRAEGDRVFVAGNQYTVSQTGADVTTDLGGGTTLVLAGVQQSSLTGDWIVSI